jgi:hypothetical protein
VPIWLVQQPSSRRPDWASMGQLAAFLAADVVDSAKLLVPTAACADDHERADGIHVMDYWQGSSRFLWERDGGRAG